jgi:peroxiredoxin
MLKTGQKAPPFTLADMGGVRVSLAGLLTAGPVVLGFFKVSCPVCQYAFPFLERLHRGPAGLRFVGISQDPPAATDYFLKDYGITFPTLIDDSANRYAASNAFRISTVPSIFLIEPDGTIGEAADGFDKAFLERLGERAGRAPFEAGDNVPAFRPG